jgi:ethanolamine utilization protein EutQ (cupin superfamily)
MEIYKVDFRSLDWQSPIKGCRFKAFLQEGRKLRLVEFTREFIEPDWCLKGHIGYVLEGEAQVDFNGHVVHFSAGDGIFIPSGINNKHKTQVISDVIKLVMVEDA